MEFSIIVLVFGAARDIVGAATVTLTVTAGAAAGDVLTQLRQTYPALNALRSLTLAVNSVYATHDTPIRLGDEIALIPPVSGG